jgi:enterochelin esterase family protein
MATPFVIPNPIKGPYFHGPLSNRKPNVPRGTVTKAEWRSSIFPGTVRDYWVYVPAQYTPDQPAAVMVFQDGGWYVSEESDFRTPIVFDNLIHEKRMPPTIGIFINPGVFPAVAEGKDPVSNRSFEYDSLGNQYVRFLLEEILPFVGQQYNLTKDGRQRAIAGSSSGGICSWTAAWERPDAFSKVLSHVGSYADFRGGHQYPTMIRKTPPKPIRVYLQAGANDLEIEAGSWPLANLGMASALQFAGYDYHLEYGDGGHDGKHSGPLLPTSLIWLWR